MRRGGLPVRGEHAVIAVRGGLAGVHRSSGRGRAAVAVAAPALLAGARTLRLRTFARGTCVLAAAISFGVLQRSFVPHAGASGTTSRRTVSESNATA
ncbi:hypothetical protein ABZ770_42090 [Streptomyces sp. NPDC006654]|uniref:hypothetical protein n=1 Tax=Streptomyces sp. NPDC006654 TaxID=3156897 RepID=UPI0033F726A8